jgi:hypothetical protein
MLNATQCVKESFNVTNIIVLSIGQNTEIPIIIDLNNERIGVLVIG